jgi:hypothetical protein
MSVVHVPSRLSASAPARIPDPGFSIVGLAVLLGEPSGFSVRQFDRHIAEHHCAWPCGCAAHNRRGLCLELGWQLRPCTRHREMRESPR